MSIADGDIKNFHSLIERLNNGDESAFDEIYKRCCAPITFLCQKFCDNHEDAEEVVQDTFVIAFKKAANIRSDTLLAYLRKIAIHECFRKRSKNSHRYEYIVHSDRPEEDYPELNQSFLPEEALQNKERQTELLRIINKLPKNRREMIYLYYYANFNTEEIAHLYNCTAATVRTTLFAARNTIKSKLEGTNKKYIFKGILVPLTAVLLMEEQVFAASYTGAGIATTATAKPTKMYVITACVVAIGCAATLLYFMLRPTVEYYDAYQPAPAYEAYTTALEEVTGGDAENIIEEIQQPAAIEEKPEQAEQPEETLETKPAEEPVQTQEPVPEAIAEPEPVEEPEILPEPEPVQEPEPEETAEPEQISEPEPSDVDRTPEILAALAVANTAGDVDSIISYYNFIFADQTRRHSTGEQLRFYVANEGSGDILVGMATIEDGNHWRMRFKHFAGGQMYNDILDLLRFME